MKWIVRGLMTIALLLVVALAALFVASQRQGAASLAAAVTINRPAAEVWPWLVEGEKLKSWVGWLVDVKDPEGPMRGKGSRQIWTMEDRNNNNQLMRINGVAEVFEPPSSLVVHVSAAEGFTGTNSWQLQGTNGGTRLVASANYEFDHWFAKMLAPLIISQAQTKFEEDIARLKSKVEAAQP